MRKVGHYSVAFVDALECTIGAEPFALPLEVAGQVVEYDVSPLPLASDRVLGLGVHAGRLIVSLGIRPVASPARRRAIAVLLDLPGADGAWALEVAAVRGFVRVRREDGPEDRAGIGSVTTADGRRIGWLDARRVFRHLLSAPSGRKSRSEAGSR